METEKCAELRRNQNSESKRHVVEVNVRTVLLDERVALHGGGCDVCGGVIDLLAC
jgi:hypothetical protein